MEPTVTESLQDTTAIAQKPHLHQCTPTGMSSYGPTEDTTLVQQTSSAGTTLLNAAKKLMFQKPKMTGPFFSCATKHGGPGHQQCFRPRNLQHLAAELTTCCNGLCVSRVWVPLTSFFWPAEPGDFPSSSFCFSLSHISVLSGCYSSCLITKPKRDLIFIQ